MAADEKTGEADILSRYSQLAIVRERRGRISPGEICNFRFLFANVSIALRPAVVKATGLNHQSESLSQNCNLKINNALRRIFREQKSAAAAPQGFENRET